LNLNTQPWLAPFNPALCAAVLAAVARGDDASALLNAQFATRRLHNAGELALRCVPHSELPQGMAYEAYIHATGCIPTRTAAHSQGALHDACNALMWLHFPRSKAVLNALQAAAIAKHGVQGTRGSLRDALTLFDESALIVCCPAADAAPQQLAQRDWHGLLVARRGDWHTVLKPLLFGHAVLQKLQTPYPAITVQVWVLEGVLNAGCAVNASNEMDRVDDALATSLRSAFAARQLTPQTLLPLPVLGVPRWWAANEDAAFYEQPQIFRPLTPSFNPAL
jgi:Protein of unknown function (DUF3025)